MKIKQFYNQFKKYGKQILKRDAHGGIPNGFVNHPFFSKKQSTIGKQRIIRLGKDGNRGAAIIGKWSYYGRSTFSSFHPNDLLVVGKYCSIAENVRFILCPGHHFVERVSLYPIDTIYFESHVSDHPNYTRIGNDVWIGDSAMILPGIRIGNGAIIGAGSVVTKDVDDFTIVAGNPARPIRKRFDDDVLIAALQEIAWWNWTDAQVFERKDFFFLPVGEAIALASEMGWNPARGIPTSYLPEIPDVLPNKLGVEDLDDYVRRFLNRDNSAYLIHQYKSLSYENLAVWIALLLSERPGCIVELGTQTGCSSTLIARLCRFLGLKTRIVTINIVDELVHRDADVEYVIEDFTGKIAEIWERWAPDLIFQDAHMYNLIEEQIAEGEKHPETVHVFHDVGFRLFQNPMRIPRDAVPTSGTGSWERHVLANFDPDLLNVSHRSFSDDRMLIHIFDNCADPNEYGLGVLKFKLSSNHDRKG